MTDSTAAPQHTAHRHGTGDVGFIGLGHMGAPMAGHLLDALGDDRRLHLYNRSRSEAAEALLSRGARWVASPRELAASCATVVCMVPATAQLRAVLEGEQGMLAGLDHPLLVVVCSTVAPSDVVELDDLARRSTDGLARVLDAPVSGGEVGAKAGTLSIMVGGDEELTAPAMEVLAACGTARRMGPLGAGQVAKACNQAIVAATIAAVAEASVVAERSGLDVAALLELLQGGYASSAVLKDKAPRFATHDYSPSGPLEYWVKDLEAYLSQAGQTGTPSLVAPQVLEAVRELVDRGLGQQDTAVLQRWVEEH